METITMPSSVGIRFAHAALQVLAEEYGIDLLHIKGPAVDNSLLQASEVADSPVARRSIDADVLVRPEHVDRLFAAMRQHGWSMKYRFEDGSAFEHAATMVHPVLAPVDVHRRFPGLGIDEDAAFDRLWAERHTIDIAGVPCPVPSVTAQRLMLIVHAARGGALDHPDIRRSWTAASEAERHAVQALAADLGSEVALAAGTGRLHEYVGAPGYELWLALSTGEISLVRIWAARVRAAPSRRAALRTAVRLLVPNARRMETALGRRPTARELSRAYLARTRWGVREIRKTLRARRARVGAGR
ncbi:nucleotidyltransferase family protein [Fodinibacter luteus]|uniref:nucleotidyltransferase family protein n=1 Tax=Fodinibacter luteus TaxID=552064 RepID=UPI0031E4F7A5